MFGRFVVFCILGYQRWISPLTGPRCRFIPSCSEYAVQAVQIHGVFVGGFLSVRRLLKCGPWHPGGFDSVPKKS